MLGSPFGVGIRGNVEVNDLSPVVTEDNEYVQDTKRDCRDGEKVAGSNIGNVIVQERSPRLGRWLSLPDHVFGHGYFGDFVALRWSSEFRQLFWVVSRLPGPNQTGYRNSVDRRTGAKLSILLNKDCAFLDLGIR